MNGGDDCWYCPVCDWGMDGLSRDMCIADVDCPGCGTRKISAFISATEWRQLREPADPADWWKQGKDDRPSATEPEEKCDGCGEMIDTESEGVIIAGKLLCMECQDGGYVALHVFEEEVRAHEATVALLQKAYDSVEEGAA